MSALAIPDMPEAIDEEVLIVAERMYEDLLLKPKTVRERKIALMNKFGISFIDIAERASDSKSVRYAFALNPGLRSR